MEVAADSAGVAGLADGADPLAGPDAVAAIDGGRAGQVGNEEKPELQWCSMTRSTMLYSFASAALMK
jgi:hypothetical protein